jgi:hypothetical protein
MRHVTERIRLARDAKLNLRVNQRKLLTQAVSGCKNILIREKDEK